MSAPSFKSDTIKLTQKDYFRGFLYQELRNWKRNSLLALFFTGIFLLIVSGEGKSAAYLVSAGAIYFVIVYILFTIIHIGCIAYGSCRIKNDPLFTSEWRLTSTQDNEGFQVNSERGDSLMKWTDFKRYKISKEAVLLRTYGNLVYIVPFRAFTGEHLDAFLGAVKEKIKK